MSTASTPEKEISIFNKGNRPFTTKYGVIKPRDIVKLPESVAKEFLTTWPHDFVTAEGTQTNDERVWKKRFEEVSLELETLKAKYVELEKSVSATETKPSKKK